MINGGDDLISVIVTSYNHAEYLDERMESLLGQTYRNLEIIVVDDCSTDSSLEVLGKYEKYDHVKIVALKKNVGYANASNFGVSICHGEYIMFAECDDFSAPSHIEILHDKMVNKENIGVAYCRSNMVDSNGNVFGDDFCYREPAFQSLCFQDTLIPQPDVQRFFLFSCVIPNMSAALIRKKFFNLVGGLSPAYRVCADWDFWCRISSHCDFYYVAFSLNNFRSHLMTVRNTSGIQVPLIEIISLLYGAFENVNFGFIEKLKFKINVGFIWACYLSQGLLGWLGAFPSIWRQSLKYDNLSLLFLLFGIVKKTIELSLRIFGGKPVLSIG